MRRINGGSGDKNGELEGSEDEEQDDDDDDVDDDDDGDDEEMMDLGEEEGLEVLAGAGSFLASVDQTALSRYVYSLTCFGSCAVLCRTWIDPDSFPL